MYVLLSQCVLLSVGTETCSRMEEEPPEGLLQPELGKTSVITHVGPAAIIIAILVISYLNTVASLFCSIV